METCGSLGKRCWRRQESEEKQPRQPRQREPPSCWTDGTRGATRKSPPVGTSGASTSAGLLGGMSLSARRHLRQHRPPRPRSPVSEGLRRSNRRRRTTYRPNNDDDLNDSDPDDVDDKKDEDYDPDDDDVEDDELPDLTAKRLRNIIKSARYRAEHREQVLANKKLYRENNRDFIATAARCYREKNRAQIAESKKRYREKNRAQLLEYNRAYRERNQARLKELRRLRREKNRDHLRECGKRYRERNQARLKESARLYRQNNLERRLMYEQQYRETHRELLREKGKRYRARLAEKKRTGEKLKALGPLTLTIPLTVCRTQPSVESYLNNFCASLPSVERQKTEEKIKALGPLKLTIPLEDFMKSIPKTSEHFSFCESFLDSYTLTDMDSGVTQALDPPDLEDLSFLENISPDEWTELLRDVEDSSSFDLEALLLPEDLVHDMSPDEGVDLMYDLVT